VSRKNNPAIFVPSQATFLANALMEIVKISCFKWLQNKQKAVQHSREVSFAFVMNQLCTVAAAQPNSLASLDLASATLPSPSPQTTTFQEYLLMQKFAHFPTATMCAADCVQRDKQSC